MTNKPELMNDNLEIMDDETLKDINGGGVLKDIFETVVKVIKPEAPPNK